MPQKNETQEIASSIRVEPKMSSNLRSQKFSDNPIHRRWNQIVIAFQPAQSWPRLINYVLTLLKAPTNKASRYLTPFNTHKKKSNKKIIRTGGWPPTSFHPHIKIRKKEKKKTAGIPSRGDGVHAHHLKGGGSECKRVGIHSARRQQGLRSLRASEFQQSILSESVEPVDAFFLDF